MDFDYLLTILTADPPPTPKKRHPYWHFYSGWILGTSNVPLGALAKLNPRFVQ
jgi:hypothetical protein